MIEVKLARNAEARRAVVAQILAYASYLFGMSVAEFERDVLGAHLLRGGHSSITDAVSSTDQAGGLDAEAFLDALGANLAAGRFRLVLVLDEAPEELVRLVGYLEAVTPELVIDLVTVSQYSVGGSLVLVPQRVDPERPEPDTTAPTSCHPKSGQEPSGSGSSTLSPARRPSPRSCPKSTPHGQPVPRERRSLGVAGGSAERRDRRQPRLLGLWVRRAQRVVTEPSCSIGLVSSGGPDWVSTMMVSGHLLG